ncbi:hypothetical protein [Tsukamurella sp. 1534]|uniref:hypothetical protein n=1 Tax=Tsukamurella sp. 1534 TaxID=1151061 RepID=UPI00031677F2|nr:hypothetical protein [Tsukamurella sp. 1534]
MTVTVGPPWRVADPEERLGRGLVFPSVGEYPIYDATAYETMMADRPRVDAFTAGLRASVRADSTVVELGCGALAPWARLADDLGAARSIAVERLPEVREAARRLIAEEGRGDRVSILSPEEYIRHDGHVDVLVAEVVGTIGGSEGAADTIGAEVARLGNPGLVVLPGGWETEVRGYSWAGAAAGHLPAFPPTAIPYLDQLRDIDGADVDPRLCVVGPHIHEGVLTAGGVIEVGDYRGLHSEHRTGAADLRAITSGSLDSLLLSVRVTIGGAVVDSFTQETSWFPVIVPLPEPIDVTPGTVLQVRAEAGRGAGGSCLDYRLSWDVHPPDGGRASGVVDVPWRASGLGTNPLTRMLLVESVQE